VTALKIFGICLADAIALSAVDEKLYEQPPERQRGVAAVGERDVLEQ
jgi:hypothetical protein